MEDIYSVGISNDYNPPSSSFNIETNNYTLKVQNNIESITKISCSANGTVEECFKCLETNYSLVYLSIDVRIDYMCVDNSMNFQFFNFNKLVYINLGSDINKKDFDIDTEVLDIGVVDIIDNTIEIYILTIACVY
ncbi:MAG: hypothetical protein ACRC3Y_13840 [Romboutsia sp.]|uniref:hypothetical protein n=1 Tax=Romboutsia sp. TaxID=1965302 RepID=UPI003F34FF3D